MIFIEFECFSKAGVKYSAALLQLMAKEQIQNAATHPYSPQAIMKHFNRPFEDIIATRRIHTFMERHTMVSRGMSGKLLIFSAKEDSIHLKVAKHFGNLFEGLPSGELDEDCIFTADEIHLVLDMANARTLAHMGDSNVKYSEVV